MAQMLTTFSSLEQSRFQAYKRATFAADTVEQWVAACLQDRYQDTTTTNNTNNGPAARPLEDLVAPGQAQDIGLVVAIAAKIYAQRLVAEAVALQEKETAAAAKQLPTSGGGAAAAAPLPPTAIWKAVLERRKRGVDPGFFLQPATEASSESLNWAVTAASSSAISHDVRRLAAEHAQEEYDKHVRAAQRKDDNNNDGDNADDASKKKPSDNSPDQAKTKKGDDGGDAMEVEETKSPGDTADPPSASAAEP